ncbi:HMG-Y-related protein A-like [Euphorbia lathyris]|uniref:HMG-Y-related protein A-like n=1 Tax=Euphorbia lathyris TaxID=212925 RepID=UPI0033136832
MATLEDSTNFPEHEPQDPNIPHYPEMIMDAIETLNEKEGSNKSAIWKQIEATNPDLPPSHSALLSYHLNKMKQTGDLIFLKNNYMKPNSNPPPKRSRGRPPKPKTEAVPVPAGTAVSSPRPRGRPPKPRDPFAPSSPSHQKNPAGSGRSRGRPPKMAKTVAGPVPTAAAPAEEGVVKKGRGRPPKVKAVAPVAG